jgi:hypothetical protein
MVDTHTLNNETEFAIDKQFKINKYFLFVSFCAYYAFAHYFLQHVINFNTLLFNDLSEQISKERIDELIDQQHKYEWVGYLFITLYFFLRLTLTTLAIYTGCFVINSKVKFSRLFSCVLMAEFVFVLQSVIKLSWLWLNKSTLTVQYVKTFSPASLINIFDYHSLQPWYLYPLQTINLFEILYWFVLAYFVSKEIKRQYWKSIDFILSSYGVALLMWVVLISFLTLNLS